MLLGALRPSFMSETTVRTKLAGLPPSSRAHLIYVQSLESTRELGVAIETDSLGRSVFLHHENCPPAELPLESVPLPEWKGVVRIVVGAKMSLDDYKRLSSGGMFHCDFYGATGERFRRILNFVQPPQHLTFVAPPVTACTALGLSHSCNASQLEVQYISALRSVRDLWQHLWDGRRIASVTFVECFTKLAALPSRIPSSFLRNWIEDYLSTAMVLDISGGALLQILLRQWSCITTICRLFSVAFTRVESECNLRLLAAKRSAVPSIALLESTCVVSLSLELLRLFYELRIAPASDALVAAVHEIRLRAQLSCDPTASEERLIINVIRMIGELSDAAACGHVKSEWQSHSALLLSRLVQPQDSFWDLISQSISVNELVHVVEVEARLVMGYRAIAAPHISMHRLAARMMDQAWHRLLHDPVEGLASLIERGDGRGTVRLLLLLSLKCTLISDPCPVAEQAISVYCEKQVLRAVDELNEQSEAATVFSQLSSVMRALRSALANPQSWEMCRPDWPWLSQHPCDAWRRSSFPRLQDVVASIAAAVEAGIRRGISKKSELFAASMADALQLFVTRHTCDDNSALETDVGLLADVVRLTRSIDVFEVKMRLNLTKRLIKRSCSADRERLALSVLRDTISRAEMHVARSLVDDAEMSAQLNGEFKSTSGHQSASFCVDVLVFCHCYWMSWNAVAVRLPQALSGQLEDYADFYASKFSLGRRRLSWHLATAQMTVLFTPACGGPSYELQCSLVAGCCILRLAEAHVGVPRRDLVSMLADDHRSQAKADLEIDRLINWTSPRSALLVVDSDESGCVRVVLNGKFSAARRKLQLLGGIKSSQSTEVPNMNSRRGAVLQCAVVRILKTRRSCSLDDIFNDVVSSVTMFAPSRRHVKEAVDEVCRKEYAQRSDVDPSRFEFVA